MRAHIIAVLALHPALSGAQNATPTPTAQIREVESAMRSLASPDSARAAGFQPIFGWIPTMGVHWYNESRMRTGRTFKLTEPAQLMFSPINGKDSLVGAAYAYVAPVGDSARPATFEGNPPWHEHPNLAPPGHTLAMLHVWFVPSPDGPFAGHNYNLPFWALGLSPPEAARMHDPVVGPKIRKAALALSEVADTSGLFPVLAAREPARTRLREIRHSVRALVPELARAQRAGDSAGWERAADRAASHWEAIRSAYLDAVLVPERRVRVQRLMDEMAAGAHGTSHHHR